MEMEVDDGVGGTSPESDTSDIEDVVLKEKAKTEIPKGSTDEKLSAKGSIEPTTKFLPSKGKIRIVLKEVVKDIPETVSEKQTEEDKKFIPETSKETIESKSVESTKEVTKQAPKKDSDKEKEQVKEDIQKKTKRITIPKTLARPKEVRKNVPKVVDSDAPEEDTDEEEEEQTKKDPQKNTLEASEYDPANVHYEGDLAVYTDPKSGYQYQWCKETNEWQPKENVSYGFEDDTHTYTDAEGVKFFWDVEKNAWFPKIDDDFMARYQMSYGFVDNTTPAETKDEKKEDEKKEEVTKEEAKKKEKVKGEKRKAPPPEPTWFEVNDQQNTKVYVSNLPTDITEEEFVDFMQKCGLVMRDGASGKMKVKLYTVPGTDILKGDALCTYIKIESVELALSVLDGYLYKGKRVQVERAKFQMKGDYNPSLKPKKKKKKEKDKLKKMQDKLFDWRPDKLRGERSKHERVVIIRNLFEPSLFDKDVGLILEYQQDLREECSKCGEVKRVVLYDRHPEGVAQISMKEPEQADECVTLLNGRWFGQRKLTAEIWDGKTKFKIAETDAQITKRLTEWDKFLETDDATKPPKTGDVAESDKKEAEKKEDHKEENKEVK